MKHTDATPGGYRTTPELRSAVALILTVVSVVAAAVAAASAAGGELVFAAAVGVAALASFVTSMMCFAADAEQLPDAAAAVSAEARPA